MKSSRATLLAALLASTSSAAALAQDAGRTTSPPTTTPAAQTPSATPSERSLSEVVVTARRRSENIEKVPASITAFGAAQIVRQGIHTEADLQSATPGLVIRQTLSQNQLNYAIRGQSVDTFSGSAPGVLPYIDEVQVSANTSTSFFDLQNIQILKGPQGTLFGRNTTGGAVLYQTQKPTNEFGGYIMGRVGNFDTSAVQGAVNIPAIEDKLLFRLAADYERNGGYIRNYYNGSYSGATDTRVVRASATFKPTTNFTDDLTVQYGWFGGTNAATTLYSANPVGSTNHGVPLFSATEALYDPSFPGFAAFLATHPRAYAGGLTALPAFDRSLGGFTTYSDFPEGHDAEAGFLADTATYRISPNLTLKDTLGLTRSRSNEQNDLDGTPYPIFAAGTPANPAGESYQTNQLSEELQLQGKAFQSRLNYILGFYYSNEEDRVNDPLLAFALEPVVPATYIPYGYSTGDHSRAVFAQGTYSITPKLNFTAGVRYTWETVTIAQNAGTIYAGAPSERADFSKPSWTVSLDYQYSPTLLLYATTRGSWRTGGFSGFAPPVDSNAAGGGNLFQPETSEDVEAGAKFSGHLAGLPARLNLAFYNQWINDIQRTAYVILNGNPLSFTANVPQAEVTGVEADTDVRLLSWLELGGSLSYADARFTSPQVSFFGTTLAFGPYADTPRWSGSVFAQVDYTLPARAGGLVGRVDAYAQSGQYFSNLNNTINPNSRLFGYALVNLRLDWTRPYGAPVTLSGYVRNLGDQPYFVGGVPQAADLGVNNASWGRPRMFGFEARYEF